MRIRPIILILACTFAMPAVAQNPVLRPGSEVLAVDSITDRYEKFDIYSADRDGHFQLVGLSFLHTRRTVVNGMNVIARTDVLILDSMVVSMDSVVLDQRTLAPILVRSRSLDTRESLDFSSGRVRFVPDTRADPQDVRLEKPVFMAGSMDLLLNALPLVEGYAARLAVFFPTAVRTRGAGRVTRPSNDGVQIVSVRVEGAEDVALPGGGHVAAWRVRVDPDEGDGPSMYWMDRESRTLVQLEMADGKLRMVRSRPPHFGAPSTHAEPRTAP